MIGYIFYTPKSTRIATMCHDIHEMFSTRLTPNERRPVVPDFYASVSYMMVPGTYAEMHRDYD
jgi:hypothetical protein